MTEKKLSSKSGWSIVGSYILQNRFVYCAVVLLIGGSCVMAVWIPRLIGNFTDSLQRGTLNLEQVAKFTGLIVTIGLIRVLTGWIGRVLAAYHGRKITYVLRKQLFEKWETLSPSYYHQHSIGDLLSHALSDVEVVRQLVAMGINVTINGVSMLAATLYMMIAHMHWALTLAGLGPMIFIPVIVRYFGPKIRSQSLKSQAALSSMSQTVEEFMGGIRTVKVFGNEAVIIGSFEEKVDVIVKEKIKYVRLSSLFGSLIPLMSSLGFIIVMSCGGYLVIQKAITLGEFITFLLYLTLLRLPLEQLGQVLNTIQRASASLKRLAGLLQVVPAVSNQKGPLHDKPIQGMLTVNHLTYRYPGTDRDVLTDISFSTGPGKTVGIIGPMGSGKTTLTNLLLRLYEPPEGKINIDGVDILRYPLLRLREGIAYVPQNGFLFSTTIHDNIVRFPEGFATQIGERGVRLSGGQKQRVAIARMVYKKSPIHILDDSLSSVDTKTERAILGNMRRARDEKVKTTIIISHRLSAVRNADEILVLNEGRIAERGTHTALVRSGGTYARLWLMQSGSKEAAFPRTARTVGLPNDIESLQSEVAEEEAE